MTNNKILRYNYKKYLKGKNLHAKRVGFFREFLPEIIFRATKLEGEPVTRKLVKSVFS